MKNMEKLECLISSIIGEDYNLHYFTEGSEKMICVNDGNATFHVSSCSFDECFDRVLDWVCFRRFIVYSGFNNG